jgi:hypothetical protein
MPDQTTSPSEELQRASDGNERYRGRARAVATITATAAGALAAGLVLNVSPGLPMSAKVLGLASIVFLIISTVVFVIASLIHPRTLDEGAKVKWRSIIRPWESAYIRNGAQTEKSLLDQSDSILHRILRFMDIALWIAGVAMATLTIALTIIAFQQPKKHTVQISFINETPEFPACPSLPRAFDAVIMKSDLERDTPELPASITGALCKADGNSKRTLLLDRSNIRIVITEDQ